MCIYQKASVLSFSGDERLNEVKRSLQNKVKQTVMHLFQKMGQMENIGKNNLVFPDDVYCFQMITFSFRAWGHFWFETKSGQEKPSCNRGCRLNLSRRRGRRGGGGRRGGLFNKLCICGIAPTVHVIFIVNSWKFYPNPDIFYTSAAIDKVHVWFRAW